MTGLAVGPSELSMKKSTKSSDIRDGIALAFTAFIISIYLYFQSGYFGLLTNAVAIFLIVVGLAGFGIELEKMTSKKLDALIDKKGGSGIFDNLGIGLAMFVVWAALRYYFPMIWVNALTFLLLLFSVYGMALGFINILFVIVIVDFFFFIIFYN